MSIPKEPRQLMINLMYLVLTAMLALNVSAEIINAFFALNTGIKKSTGIVDNTNGLIQQAIDKQVSAYPTPPNQGFKSKALEATKITKEFEAYMSEITGKLVEGAGGLDVSKKDDGTPKYTDGRPVRYKDKDVTTRMFITEGLGAQVEKKIQETRAKFEALLAGDPEKDKVIGSIALKLDDISSDSKAKTWVDYKFKQMPVAAVMPSLTKMVADAKTSETALLNHFFNKVGGTDIKFDQFKVAFSPKKGYLNRGEKFEAEVFLAAFSSNPGVGASVTVNGSSLPLKEGVASYSTVPTGIGKQKVTATASIKNPLTGVVTTTKPVEFEYEVGEPSATISAEKMNVFYIGVDNPVAVSAAGVSSSAIQVSAEGVTLNKKDANNYNVTASRPGKAYITVSAPGLAPVKKEFRVKSIPDPKAMLRNGKWQGGLGSGEMQVMPGMMARLENFDFDARCNIQSFQMIRQARREDPVAKDNSGENFSSDCQRLAQLAKPGDTYFFLNIRGRCPGDGGPRDLGSMTFFIR